MEKRLNLLLNSMGIIYLGDLLIDKYNDEELKNEIHSLADQEIYDSVVNSRSVEKMDNVVLLSLILIAIEKYDSSFWPHIVDYYPKTFPADGSEWKRSEQWINNKLREKITYVFGNTKSGTRIINHLLVEAFVPKNYLANFFKFAHAILKHNYDYFLFDHEDKDAREEVENELIEFFSHLFSSTLIDSSDKKLEVSFDNNYYEYVLITSTKIALGDEKIARALLPLILDILRILEKQYFEEDLSHYLKNKYLAYGFNEWNKDVDNKIEVYNKTVSSADRSIIKPRIIRYNYHNRTLVLKSRRHNVINYKIGDVIEIQVLNNGEIVYKNDKPVIKQIMEAYRIDPIEIELDKFFGNLEYRLNINGNCYYSSKGLLEFNYMFFDYAGFALTNYSNYEGNMMILTDTKLLFNDFNYEVNNGYLYLIEKTKDTILDFGSIRITSEEKLFNTVIGDKQKISASMNNKEIEVFKELKSIRVEENNIDRSTLHLRINGSNYRIPESEIQPINNGDEQYIEIELDFLELESDFYNVEVREGVRLLYNSEFILDRKIELKEKLRNGIEYNQKLESSFFEDIRASQDVISLKNEPLEIMTKEFSIQDKVVKYSKPILGNSCRFNDLYYHPNILIWLPEVKNTIEFFYKNIKAISISSLDNRLLNEYIFEELQQSHTFYKDDLEALMNKNETNGLYVYIFTDGNRREFFKILKNNHLVKNKNNISFSEGHYYLDLQFYGKNELFIKVFQNDIHIFETSALENGLIKLPLKIDCKMKIQINEGKDNIFLGTKELLHKKIDFYHRSDHSLMSKKYKIESIYSFETDTYHEVRNSYIKDIRYEENQIVGTMFFIHNGYKIVEFKKLNPIRIEFLEEVFDYNHNFSVNAYLVDIDDDGLYLGDKSKEISSNGIHVRSYDKKLLVDYAKLSVS